MSDVEKAFCSYKDCKDYGVRNQDNNGRGHVERITGIVPTLTASRERHTLKK